MSDQAETPPSETVPAAEPYKLENDEKATPIMIYTQYGMARGELVSKEPIRVSTWLRSTSGITYLTMYRAQTMTISSGGPHVDSYTELHIPISQIIAYHLLPPAQEPLDYDPSEPNRKLVAVILNFGSFRALANIRIAETTTLSLHLRSSRETYISVYDIEVSNPNLPKMAAIKAAMMLVQPSLATFAVK